MTTFAPRRHLPVPAGRRSPLRFPVTDTAPGSAATPRAPRSAPGAPAQRRLLGLLTGRRSVPGAHSLRGAAARAAIVDATVHDAPLDVAYRDDEGGWGDDGGWG